MTEVFAGTATLYLWCARFNLGLGILSLLTCNHRAQRTVWILAGLGWTAQTAVILHTFGLTSLSGIPPNFTFAGLVLCLCQVIALKKDQGHLRPLFSSILLVVMALCAMVPEAVRHDTFMMGFLYAKLFFLSRPLSLGLTLFALAGSAESIMGAEKGRVLATTEARNTAMLAALCFLGGEIAGCYWGFVGWGTTWRWSGNFYFSAMVFVLFMAALHVPRSVFASVRSYAWAMFTPLGLLALCLTISKVVRF